MVGGGGGKLKYANGSQASGGDKLLSVTGLGFRPYAVVAVNITNADDYGSGRGFVCDADGNIAKKTSNFNATVSDDGFTIAFSNYGMPYHWWAIGK